MIILWQLYRAEYKNTGIGTPNDLSQQMGYMNREKGYLIKPHHNDLLELLIIRKKHFY